MGTIQKLSKLFVKVKLSQIQILRFQEEIVKMLQLSSNVNKKQQQAGIFSNINEVTEINTSASRGRESDSGQNVLYLQKKICPIHLLS